MAIALNAVFRSGLAQFEPQGNQPAGVIVASIAMGIMFFGAAAGIVALSGIRRYGRKGILIKSLIGILLPALLTAAAIPVIFMAKERAEAIRSGKYPIEGQLALLAEEINNRGPKMVDEVTRMERADAMPGRTFVYTYSVLSAGNGDISQNTLEEGLRPQMLKLYKTHEDMKVFRDNGVTIVYRYNDGAGERIGEITVGPQDL